MQLVYQFCQHGHSGDARCALVFPHDGGARNVISRPKVCLVAGRCYSRHGAEVTSFLGRPHLIVLLLRLRLVEVRVAPLRGRCSGGFVMAEFLDSLGSASPWALYPHHSEALYGFHTGRQSM